MSRLPLSEEGEGQSAPKKKFKDYPIDYLPVGFAEICPEEGRQYLFVAIDRTGMKPILCILCRKPGQRKVAHLWGGAGLPDVLRGNRKSG